MRLFDKVNQTKTRTGASVFMKIAHMSVLDKVELDNTE